MPARHDHHDLALDAAPVAQVVVGADGVLSVANQAAKRLLALSAADVGRPLEDLELSHRPVELQTVVRQALDSGCGRVLRDVLYEPGGDDPVHDLDVLVSPLLVDGTAVGVSIAFTDTTTGRLGQAELEQAAHALDRAHSELQAIVEELEATNEELRATNGELELMSEALLSTNEALETLRVELLAAARSTAS